MMKGLVTFCLSLFSSFLLLTSPAFAGGHETQVIGTDSAEQATEPAVHDTDVRSELEAMQEAHEAEMAQVENYVLVEKTKIAPLPDIRYYEACDSGFCWVTDTEIRRRDMAAGEYDQYQTNPDQPAPSEVADNPTAMLEGYAIAAERFGLVGVGREIRKAKAEGDEGFEEQAGGIQGADDSSGLFGDESLAWFKEKGRHDVQAPFGLFFEDYRGERFHRVGHPHECYDMCLANEDEFFRLEDYYHHVRRSGHNSRPDSEYDYRGGVKTPVPGNEYMNTTYAARFCQIYVIQGETTNDGGSELKHAELWACYFDDRKLRPVRIKYEILHNTASGYKREFVERIADKYKKVGPVTLPHRVKERVHGGAEDIGEINWQDAAAGIYKLRKYFINMGSPSPEAVNNIMFEAQHPEYFGGDEW